MRTWLPEELETVACDFCGTMSDMPKFRRGDGMAVVECPNCGLAFLNPRPRAELIPLFYEADYFDGSALARGEGGLCLPMPDATTAALSGLEARQDERAPSLEVLTKLCGGVSGKQIIEVGCATGDILARLNAMGGLVQGIELSDYAAGIARGRGFEVMAGTLEEFAAHRSECADAVLAFEVIEHVLSPTRFLETAAKLLRPGGIFLFSTPNYTCTRRYGAQWRGFTGSYEHIYFFDPGTLTQLGQKLGFVPRYLESSRDLGGPHVPKKGLALQHERLKSLCYLAKEIGWAKAFRAFSDRTSPQYAFGVGHTLLMALEKPAFM